MQATPPETIANGHAGQAADDTGLDVAEDRAAGVHRDLDTAHAAAHLVRGDARRDR